MSRCLYQKRRHGLKTLFFQFCVNQQKDIFKALSFFAAVHVTKMYFSSLTEQTNKIGKPFSAWSDIWPEAYT
jgi:hypothetical protein